MGTMGSVVRDSRVKAVHRKIPRRKSDYAHIFRALLNEAAQPQRQLCRFWVASTPACIVNAVNPNQTPYTPSVPITFEHQGIQTMAEPRCTMHSHEGWALAVL